ncbi:MAG: ABC transporter ATP-binding protein [Hydrogenibacillus schlegelii]|uniref:ABC transporter ATP-binding protein n=1 Tax=Hydrogenibacillus schlegelii TaxID=1484 RepID=A0A947GAU8_HYDSH|nr:ABC transporter ATP-binding protein [Hydrogenibacillus schlegelii]
MRVELEGLSMRFGDVTAVDRLDAVIESGELVALLGPSGCGKTTTLFLLAGLYRPTAGVIRFDGAVVNDVPPERREIGMVFQNYALYPHMTAFDNIAFPLKVQKIPKNRRREMVLEMARLVRIESLLERKPAQLSGGQQQRVAIARALVKRPKLLLLDEPLSNLDARLRLEMREEIRRIVSSVGITTVFVTHDQEEAMSLADRILLMREGRKVQYDAPDMLYLRPAHRFVAEFLGNPPINLLSARVGAGGRCLLLNGGTPLTDLPEDIEPLPPETPVVVGIRPEDFRLEAAGVALGDPSACRGKIAGRVAVRETTGRETLLRVETCAGAVRVLAPTGKAPHPGTAVVLAVEPSALHLFHPETGESLRKIPQGRPKAASGVQLA